MLLVHPVMQGFGILVALYAFATGMQRFRSVHLKQKVPFAWKRHVLAGRIAFGILAAGFVVGLVMVRVHWGQNLMTLGHGKMALVTLPLMIVGFLSGHMLNGKSGHKEVLRVIHGLNNMVVLLLLLNQARLGLEVYGLFVSGL